MAKWNPYEPWQLSQLQRIAAVDPDRVEIALNTLWRMFPDLFEASVVSATESGSLSASRAAELLDQEEAQVVDRVASFHEWAQNQTGSIVEDEHHVARLAEGQVPVWEIVREYRKVGGVETLANSFPSLTRGELAAAMRYAQEHPAEIEAQIARYEDLLTLRRSGFPYTR